MTLEKRAPKIDDQEKVEEAVTLIYELMGFNQQIEPSLWAGAIISVLAMGYKNSGFSYKQFSTEMRAGLAHYENFWED